MSAGLLDLKSMLDVKYPVVRMVAKKQKRKRKGNNPEELS
jgi:hypothetical protein